jgi:hypothetical protein
MFWISHSAKINFEREAQRAMLIGQHHSPDALTQVGMSSLPRPRIFPTS